MFVSGSLEKSKKSSKPKVAEASGEPRAEVVEREEGKGEGSGKKKRKKKKKMSDKEGIEGGDSKTVSKLEGEKPSIEDKLEGEKVEEKEKLDDKEKRNVEQSVEQKLEDGEVKDVELEKEREGEQEQGVKQHKVARESVKHGEVKGEEEKVVEREKTEKVTDSQEADTEKKEGKGHVSCSSSGPSSPTDSGIGSGVEHVAMETPSRPAKSRSSEDVGVVGAIGEKDSRRRKLHVCACCGAGETVAKSFKRCQK